VRACSVRVSCTFVHPYRHHGDRWRSGFSLTAFPADLKKTAAKPFSSRIKFELCCFFRVLWASVASRKGAATTTRLQFLDRAHTHSHSWAETCTCLNCCWRRSRDLKIIWKHRNKLHTHTHTHARTQVQSKVSESESLKIKWQQQQLQRRQPALEIVTNQISTRIFICFALIFCFTITPKKRHKAQVQ